MMAFVAAFASLGAVAMQPRASLSGALPNNTCCARFSPNKIDYADRDVLVVPNVMNESVCCSLCAAHNANRPHDAPASTNCTIAVWYVLPLPTQWSPSSSHSIAIVATGPLLYTVVTM